MAKSAYKDYAVQMALKYGLDPEIFLNQIRQESAWNPKAVSPKGALGLGQLMPGTAEELGVDPTDPLQNLEGSAKYMRQMLDRFGGNYRLALAAYLQGPGGVEKNGITADGRKYIAQILTPTQNLEYATKQYGKPLDITGFRKYFPEYDHMDDETIAKSLHATFYPDMEYGQFRGHFGVKPSTSEIIGSLPSATKAAMSPIAKMVQFGPLIARARDYDIADAKGITEDLAPRAPAETPIMDMAMEMATKALPGIGHVLAGIAKPIWKGLNRPFSVNTLMTPDGKPLSAFPMPGFAIEIPDLASKEEQERAKERIQVPATEHPVFKLGKWLEPDLSKVPTDVRQSYPFQWVEQFSMLPTQLLTYRVHPGAGLAQSMGMEAVDMYKRGIAQGIPEKEAVAAAMEAAPLGAVDMVSTMLLSKIPALGKLLTRKEAKLIPELAQKYPRTAGGLFGMLGEIITEEIQTLGEDRIAKKRYKEVVDTWGNVVETAGVTSVPSFVASALLASLGIRMRPKHMTPPPPSAEYRSKDISKAEAEEVYRDRFSYINEVRDQRRQEIGVDTGDKFPAFPPEVLTSVQNSFENISNITAALKTETNPEKRTRLEEDLEMEQAFLKAMNLAMGQAVKLGTPIPQDVVQSSTVGPSPSLADLTPISAQEPPLQASPIRPVPKTEPELTKQILESRRQHELRVIAEFDKKLQEIISTSGEISTEQDVQRLNTSVLTQAVKDLQSQRLPLKRGAGTWLKAGNIGTITANEVLSVVGDMTGIDPAALKEQALSGKLNLNRLLAEKKYGTAETLSPFRETLKPQSPSLADLPEPPLQTSPIQPVPRATPALTERILESRRQRELEAIDKLDKKLQAIKAGLQPSVTQEPQTMPPAQQSTHPIGGEIFTEQDAQKLSLAVLTQAVKDLQSRSPSLKREAETWLRAGNIGTVTADEALSVIGDMLGLDPSIIRARALSGNIDPGKLRQAEKEFFRGAKKDVTLRSASPFEALSREWYSKLNVVVRGDLENWPKRFTGEEALRRLKEMAKAGKFKQEELDDMIRLGGLDVALGKNRTFTRQEFADVLMDHLIEVETIEYSTAPGAVGPPKHADSYTLGAAFPRTVKDKGKNHVELILWSPQAEELGTDEDHYMVDLGTKQIGWLRGTEYTTDDGSDVFLIEEMQSPRHQARQHEPEIADAPFRESWLRLLARKAIKYAAKKGIKKIAWTTGEQQEMRWWEATNSRVIAARYTPIPEVPGTGLLRMETEAGPLEWADDDLSFSERLGEENFMKVISSAGKMVTLDRPLENVELPSWPKTLYGHKGEYHSAKIGTAFKDALRPAKAVKRMFKVDTGIGPFDSTFSEQPGIELTDQQIERLANQPIMLYSFDPFYFTAHNLRSLKSYWKATANKSEDTKIVSQFVEDSLGTVEKYVIQPWWAAKDNKRLRPIVETAHAQQNAFNEHFVHSIQPLAKIIKLSKREIRLLEETMWSIEGQKVPGMPDQFTKNEDGTGAVNEEFYTAYRKWAEEKVGAKIAEVMVEVRRSLDEDNITRWNSAISSGELSGPVLQALNRQTFGIPNYLPHVRRGKYVLSGYVKNPDGTLKKVFDHATNLSVILDHIPLLKGVNARRFEKSIAPRLVEMLENDPVIKELGEITWVVSKRVSPEIPYVDNHAILGLALDDVVTKAVDSIEDSGLRSALRATLPKAVADVLRAKGDWGHTAERKGILGYEMENLAHNLYMYKQGLYAALTKMETVRKLTPLLQAVEKTRPNERAFATQYVKDVLEPRSKFEDAANVIRSLAGLKYLGGSAKTAIVNLGTFWVQGASRLAVDVGVAADKFVGRAVLKMPWRGSKSPNLPQWQKRLLDELITTGLIQDQMVQDVKAKVASDPTTVWFNRLFEFFMYPVSVTERFSRAITAIAAADAAFSGRVKNLDLGEIGREPTPDQYEAIKSYATEVVSDSHGLYTKANKPAFARTGRIGKLLATSYTFRSFPQGMFHMYSWIAKNGLAGDTKSIYALTRGILATLLLAGARALPMALLLRKAYREWLPEDWHILGDDPLIALRKAAPEGMKNLVTDGLSGALGVTTASSFGLDTPENLEQLLGVPVSLVKDTLKAKRALEAGDLWKMAEAIAPVAILRNFLIAMRLKEKGQTTMTGRPVALPGSDEPLKLTEGESAWKVFGFQPLRFQQAWDVTEIAGSLMAKKAKKQTSIADNWATARANKDVEGMQQAMDELLEWNIYWAQRRRPDMVINIGRSIQTRVTPKKPPVQARLRQLQLVEELMSD